MSLPVGSAGGWALRVEGCVGGLLVLRSGNDVIMSTLIPLESGIHVRQTSTQISPPSHPSNCWDYVWQWRRVRGHVPVLQLNSTHTHTHTHTQKHPHTSTTFFSSRKAEPCSFGIQDGIRMDWSTACRHVLRGPKCNIQGWNHVKQHVLFLSLLFHPTCPHS